MPILGVLENICDVCLFPNNKTETHKGEGKVPRTSRCGNKTNANTDRSKRVGMHDERERQALNR